MAGYTSVQNRRLSSAGTLARSARRKIIHMFSLHWAIMEFSKKGRSVLKVGWGRGERTESFNVCKEIGDTRRWPNYSVINIEMM